MDTVQQHSWREADAVFDRLLDLPPAERAAALAALPDGLRALVERLLQADGGSGLLDHAELLEHALPADASAVPRRIGGWQLGEELGRGGMAVVYAATREVAGGCQQAALKLLTVGALAADGRRRFMREQQALARLTHPHVAALLDAGVLDDGTPYLAMQRVDGERIDHWCRQRALAPAAIVQLFLQVCEAVIHAHRLLVVHRDLKPGNILVDDGGHVYLLDFGIARLLDDAIDAESTRTGARALTPQYAAPEQFAGRDCGTAADVFGLGAVLYQLLAGRPPRLPKSGGDSPITLPSRAASDGPALPPELRPLFSRSLRGDLDAILLRALAIEPTQRYPDAAAFAADLRRWLDGFPVQAVRADRLYRTRKFVARHRGGVAAGLLTAVAIAIGIIGTLSQAHRAERAAASARAEAIEAQRARAESEAALQRAEALRDLLLGLFRASRPLRPQDEMPSVDSLLQSGGERARMLADSQPLLAAEMLAAIATVYLQRRLPERGAELIEHARSHVADARESAPRSWARVMLASAQQSMLLRDFATADAVLADIESVLANLPGDDALRHEAAYERARVRFIEQQPAAAIEQLQALRHVLEQRPEPLLSLQQNVVNLLGWALANDGRHAQADVAYREVIRLAEQEYGPRHLNTAVHRANAAGNAMMMGAFAAAEQGLRDALASYDAISAEPLEQRATARSLLGMLLLASGRLDEAAAHTRAAREEWASLLGLPDVAHDPVYRYRHGMILAAGGDHAGAAAEYRAALGLTWPAGRSSQLARIDVAILLAEAECSGNGAGNGSDAVAAARGEVEATADYTDARWLARLQQATAACALAGGDAVAALAALQQAQPHDDALPAGRADEVARRELLRARIHDALGDPASAAAARADALRRLSAVGLDTHPLLDGLR